MDPGSIPGTSTKPNQAKLTTHLAADEGRPLLMLVVLVVVREAIGCLAVRH